MRDFSRFISASRSIRRCSSGVIVSFMGWAPQLIANRLKAAFLLGTDRTLVSSHHLPEIPIHIRQAHKSYIYISFHLPYHQLFRILVPNGPLVRFPRQRSIHPVHLELQLGVEAVQFALQVHRGDYYAPRPCQCDRNRDAGGERVKALCLSNYP